MQPVPSAPPALVSQGLSIVTTSRHEESHQIATASIDDTKEPLKQPLLDAGARAAASSPAPATSSAKDEVRVDVQDPENKGQTVVQTAGFSKKALVGAALTSLASGLVLGAGALATYAHYQDGYSFANCNGK